MKQSFKLFNFVGSPVELSYWFFLLFLFLPIPTVIAVFISILIHELSHAYVADRLGWMVSGIHIDLFSGSAAIDTNIHEKDSIPVVAAGPLSNLILAAISFLASDFVAVSSDFELLFLQLTINKVASAITIIEFENFMIIILELG